MQQAHSHVDTVPATKQLVLFIDRVEAGLGWLIQTFYTVIVVIAFGGYFLFSSITRNNEPLSTPMALAVGAAWGIYSALQFMSLVFLWRRMETNRYPIALTTAEAHPAVAAPLRPLVALWWLSTAAAIVIMCELAVRQINSDTSRNSSEWMRALTKAVFLFGAAFSMNVHLLIAVKSLFESPRLLKVFWRVRILVDLLVTFCIPAIHVAAVDRWIEH